MLDLAPIRARLATPILCERCGDFPAAFEGPDEVVQLLCTHCADGQELDALPEHQTPEREVIAALLSEVERLQAGGCARDQRTTQFCAEAVAKDAGIARLTSELAAARRGPVVEWRKCGTLLRCELGAFRLDVAVDDWTLRIQLLSGEYGWLNSGPETGDAGKAACEAAYRRAVGLA